MSKYTQGELNKIYTTERRNWQKNVSKARRSGINVNVQYPKKPEKITEASIRNIIEKHNAWFYKTYDRPKKQSGKQQQFVTKLPKYQTVPTPKKERKTPQRKHKPRAEKPIEKIYAPVDYIPPEDYAEPEPQEGYRPIDYSDIDETEYTELNQIQNEIEEQFTYIPEEGYWIDNQTGEIVSSDAIVSSIAGDIADIDDYAEDFINEQLQKLSSSHENAARFLNEQFTKLPPEQKANALERLANLDESEIEDMAVELYYSDSTGGTKAAAKLFRIISPDNDMKSAKEFMNRLYDESDDGSPYKQQAIENRRIKQTVSKRRRNR